MCFPHIFSVCMNNIKRQIRTVFLILNSVESKINNIFDSKLYLDLIKIDISKVYNSVCRHRVSHILSKIQSETWLTT